MTSVVIFRRLCDNDVLEGISLLKELSELGQVLLILLSVRKGCIKAGIDHKVIQ